ncbi:hypothetical protein WR25_26131 [Diploscapter pachys]|uniref:Uncharacterized protein n=1 Tax=Diploscapter pachys TaxID=2018661 RepID=A0A2A2J5V2_9BILA|nr:hypothetical protein WR25_26131 [Diploscapter pachys]
MRAPADPVLSESSVPPLPKSSGFSWTTTDRPMIEKFPLREAVESRTLIGIPDMSDHIVWSSVIHLHRIVVRSGCGAALIGRAGLVDMESMNTRGQTRQTTVDLKLIFRNEMDFELDLPVKFTKLEG